MIDVADIRKIGLADYDLIAAFLLLDPLKDIQPSSSSISFDGIGAVRYLLQFLENKLGNDDRPGQESGLRNICDPAIDYDRGIQYKRQRFAGSLLDEKPAKRCQVYIVTFDRSDDQPDIPH